MRAPSRLMRRVVISFCSSSLPFSCCHVSILPFHFSWICGRNKKTAIDECIEWLKIEVKKKIDVNFDFGAAHECQNDLWKSRTIFITQNFFWAGNKLSAVYAVRNASVKAQRSQGDERSRATRRSRPSRASTLVITAKKARRAGKIRGGGRATASFNIHGPREA